MQKTPASRDLRRSRLERSVEDILFQYPYLIETGLPVPRRQVRISRNSRIDLLFDLQKDILVVEIKRGLCTVRDVWQLQRYIHTLDTPPLSKEVAIRAVRGIIVGRALSLRGRREISQAPENMKFLQLDIDIPTRIVMCRACRKVYAARLDACVWCRETGII